MAILANLRTFTVLTINSFLKIKRACAEIWNQYCCIYEEAVYWLYFRIMFKKKWKSFFGKFFISVIHITAGNFFNWCLNSPNSISISSFTRNLRGCELVQWVHKWKTTQKKKKYVGICQKFQSLKKCANSGFSIGNQDQMMFYV